MGGPADESDWTTTTVCLDSLFTQTRSCQCDAISNVQRIAIAPTRAFCKQDNEKTRSWFQTGMNDIRQKHVREKYMSSSAVSSICSSNISQPPQTIRSIPNTPRSMMRQNLFILLT